MAKTIESQGQLIPEEQTQIVPAGHSPLALVEMAMKQNASIEVIERMVALAERMQAKAARQAWQAAMQRAQEKMEPVRRNAMNPQTHSKYSTYEQLNSAARPIYTAEGLSITYNTAPSVIPENILVLAHVSHVDGHTEPYQIDMPADGKGAKGGDVMTRTHATGSAFSYGRRYLLKAIFDLAEFNEDDDGNAAGKLKEERLKNKLPLDFVNERLDWIANSKDVTELQRIFGTAFLKAEEINDVGAQSKFMTAKDKRKQQIKEGAL